MDMIKKNSLEKALKLFSKVSDISDKEISLITVKDNVKKTLNLEMATHNKVS